MDVTMDLVIETSTGVRMLGCVYRSRRLEWEPGGERAGESVGKGISIKSILLNAFLLLFNLEVEVF